MKPALLKIVIFATACALSAAAAAQQYKWVDKNGKTVYGDTPPPGVKATPLRGPSAPAAPPASAAKDAKGAKGPASPAQVEADFRKREQERQEAEQKSEKERAEADARRSNCARAQASLRDLQSGQRVARTNQAGEREFIDDTQRAAEIERAQRNVKEWCS